MQMKLSVLLLKLTIILLLSPILEYVGTDSTPIPDDITPGATYARFRITTDSITTAALILLVHLVMEKSKIICLI